MKLKNINARVTILLAYSENNAISYNWGPPEHVLRGLSSEPYISFSKARLII
jgi:hypothetical protein